MRVTFLLSTLWLSGGVRDIIEIANGLDNKGHKITLVLPSGTIQPDIFQEIKPSISVLATRIPLPANPYRANPFSLARVVWSLAKSTPLSDVVISTQTPTTLANLLATKIFNRGLSVWYYQDYLEMFIGRPVETWLLKHAMRWHKRALVLSNFSKEELNSFFPCDVFVVRIGISHAENFKPIPSDSLVKGAVKNILFLGDMRPRKGLFDFLEAARIVQTVIPDIHLWIVSKEECQISTQLSYEYIFRPSRAELARLYGSCDVFVSASWWESFGLPPLEAMACGAPVVLTDSRGVREFANPGVNCLMTPPQDPLALANAIIQVLKDHELASQLRTNGPSTAQDFTWEASVSRFEQALLDLTK